MARAARPSCAIKMLPPELVISAARVAVETYPGNRPPLQQFASTIDGAGSDDIYPPMRIAAITDRYWGPKPRVIPVQFLDNPDAETRRLILLHANLWDCGVTFAESSEGVVRIARTQGGYWSYLGTDVKMVSGVTMNLQGFTARTPAAEYRRVVVHEFGHTLGFPHEHMRMELVNRLDREKTVAYFGRTQGWSRRDVELQVLTPLDETSVMGTPPDSTSIMCYQLPGEITKNGVPILGGDALNATDLGFADSIYPLASSPPIVTPPPPPPPPPSPPPVDVEPEPPVEPDTGPHEGVLLTVGDLSGPYLYTPHHGPAEFRFEADAKGVYTVTIPATTRWTIVPAGPGPGGPTLDTADRSGRKVCRVAFRAKAPGVYHLEVARKVRKWSGTFRILVERGA